jgi:hypothetical protein
MHSHLPFLLYVSPLTTFFDPGAATVGVITETNAEKAIEELKAYEVRLCPYAETEITPNCPPAP